MNAYRNPHANLTITFTQNVTDAAVINCAKRMKDLEPTLDFKVDLETKTILCKIKGENFAFAPFFEPVDEPFKYDSLLSFIDYLVLTFKIIEITGHICFTEGLKCSSIKRTLTDKKFYDSVPEDADKDVVLEWLKKHDLKRCNSYVHTYVAAYRS